MNITTQTRGRKVARMALRYLAGLSLLLLALPGWAGNAALDAGGIPITVYKNPNCGCCSMWINHLAKDGFVAEVHVVDDTRSIRSELGVPNEVVSCHTAVVGDYWVEGHVPAYLITRLLNEHPDDVAGIAAPGMPLGSPGMEHPNASTYQVVTVDKTGNVKVYATVEGQQSR